MKSPASTRRSRIIAPWRANSRSIPAHLALAFVTSRPFVTANIIGARNIEQLRHILAAPRTIAADLEKRINAIHQIRGNPAP